jgi:hypothetical protein
LLTYSTGKFRELQRTTVQYARVLDMVGDEDDEDGNMIS